MKKGLKRIISLVLCAAMLASIGAVGASAATKTECEGKCDKSPIVILPGINHSPTYLYNKDGSKYLDADGNEVGGTLLILELSKLWATIPQVAFSLIGTLLLQHNVGLDKAAYKAASAAFWVQECDNDGNHVQNLQTQRWNHPISEMTEDDKQWLYRMIPLQRIEKDYGGDHIYMYTFNLVGDPMKSADELDEYIQMVKDQTGHDKVTLLPVSLGGTILTAYIDKYHHKDIDQIVNIVACLDGTDVVADMMERKWNLADEYFYHEFIPPILGDDAALGYLINCVLHILPRSGVDALLSGAISGILDTIMINCPQIWAMIPSNRYYALAEKYLDPEKFPEKKELKAKTDRFQKARENLKENIHNAVADGVKVNTIACGNLDLGEQDYTFFNIVASADKVNSDGIINLSSTTMGATGAAGNNTLGEGYTQKYTNPNYPDHSYISPDNMIDVSTAALPDNTWIFLEQHHEVGNNDVVLNLAKAILMGEVDNVHDNPEKYPQFNGACNTKELRRWKLDDAKKFLAENGDKLSPEDKAELEAAITEGEAVINATIADAERATAANQNIINILTKHGYFEEPEEESKLTPILNSAMEGASKFLVDTIGGGSLVDWFLSPIRKIFG